MLGAIESYCDAAELSSLLYAINDCCSGRQVLALVFDIWELKIYISSHYKNSATFHFLFIIVHTYVRK